MVLTFEKAEVPKSVRSGTSMYRETLEGFVKSNLPSAKVKFTGKKPQAVVAGLRMAKKTQSALDGKVFVSQRGQDVYLSKVSQGSRNKKK